MFLLKRILAYIIDIAIIGFITQIVNYLPILEIPNPVGFLLVNSITLVIAVGYFVVLEKVFSASFGKMIFKLKVKSKAPHKNQIFISQLIVRNLIKTMMPFGVIWYFFCKKQMLHDIISVSKVERVIKSATTTTEA